MSRLQSINFFLTETEACSYLPEEKACFIVVDPTGKIGSSEYSQLSQSGLGEVAKLYTAPNANPVINVSLSESL